ncbi:hypothetical protein [Amycolatopsis antarctica]|uniref:hypothetical protein n=1 Tax=Amycolatopsis antarctica TaxID=1854586 RepID=UPI0010542DE8|nr:hypothetical protein [Amycolatopsis antarctica]
MTKRGRGIRLMTLAACAGLTLTACADTRAGTALPDGDEASEHVSAKFSGALDNIESDFTANTPRKTVLDQRVRVNEITLDQQTTTTQVGDPIGVVSRERSNENPDDNLEYLRPPGSDLQYIRLGPFYSSLAPTPWVSRADPDPGIGPCSLAENLIQCRMIKSIRASTATGGDMEAKSLSDGGTVLNVGVTLETFLRNRLLGDDEVYFEKLPAAALEQHLEATIVLTPESQLQNARLEGVISGTTTSNKPFTMELLFHYQILAAPRADEIPAAPPADQVTLLPDQAAIDDFNSRRGKLVE